MEEEQEQEYIEAASMSLSLSLSAISLSSFSKHAFVLPHALSKTEAIGVAPADKSEVGPFPRDAIV